VRFQVATKRIPANKGRDANRIIKDVNLIKLCSVMRERGSLKRTRTSHCLLPRLQLRGNSLYKISYLPLQIREEIKTSKGGSGF
jgi:hypothetical protein